MILYIRGIELIFCVVCFLEEESILETINIKIGMQKLSRLKSSSIYSITHLISIDIFILSI